MLQSLNPDVQRVQGLIVTTGFLTFVCVGVAACFALVAVAFWFAVQVVLYLLQAVVETFSSIGLTWVNADPFTKVIIMAALVFAGYRVYQWRIKRGVKHA